ncbi:MAG: endonuclease III [Paludibacteraceae bacterium]|nr:endonuclease III [Paludibacteraceae bacterium]
MTTKERYNAVIEWFSKNMPDAKSELNYENAFQLLIAVMLSAQCTDKRVNMVTPKLFRDFPTPETLAKASQDIVFQYIKSISYPNAKAKHLVEMAKMLVNDFDSKVPNNREDLEKLPGVGRKTANVMLIVIFNEPAMPVDTHVFRVANRIGLTNHSRNVLTTEKTLVKNFPKDMLNLAHHWLILHGRYTCTAIKPKCHQCGISHCCKFVNK